HVAILIQNHVVSDVLHVGVVIGVQHFLVVHNRVGIVILGAVSGDIFSQTEVGDGGIRQDLRSHHALDLAVGHGHQEQVVLLHVGDVEVVGVHGVVHLGVVGLDEDVVVVGALVTQLIDDS